MNEMLASAASIWVLSIAAWSERGDWGAVQACAGCADDGVPAHGITGLHASDLAGLPMPHRDPFDRLLVAQARALCRRGWA